MLGSYWNIYYPHEKNDAENNADLVTSFLIKMYIFTPYLLKKGDYTSTNL